MAHYGVVGGGSWGTALAIHLARARHRVDLWVHNPGLAREIRGKRENTAYLPGFPIPREIGISPDLQETLHRVDRILLVVPSHFSREVYCRVRESAPEGAALLVATKGIEEETWLRMTQVLAEVWREPIGWRSAVLSGPSFAFEVARGDPTTVVVASEEEETASLFQKEISHGTFRGYRNRDVVGVELAGALKNVIAIAAGVVAGLGMGHNTTAALLTRGLAEITRLAVALGGREATLAGLAGMGDLVLTCTGDLSRNRRVGKALGEGKPLPEITRGMRMVAEGIRTTRAARALARRHGIDMPITEEVYRLLFEEGRSPRDGIRDLLRRPLIQERGG